MTLGQYLKQTGLSQKAFGEIVGASDPQINRIVRGKRTPSMALAKRIVAATGGKVTLDELAFGAGGFAAPEANGEAA